MKKLEDLHIGDEVIIDYATYKRVGVVIRTTKLNVEVKAGDSIMMYSKKNGRQKGCSGYCVRRIVIATDELKAEAEEHNRRTKYRVAILMYDIDKLSTDKLEQIYNIIKSEEK